MKKALSVVLAGAVAGLVAAHSPAMGGSHEMKKDEDAGLGGKLGILKCQTIPGTRVNLLIHSAVNLNCKFETTYGMEEYKGESGVGLGVDINWKRKETIAYTVLSGTMDYEIGSYGLSGKFVGGKGSATVGAGAGAAVLVGGGERNFTLQPIALEGSTGLGVAGGVGYLFLEAKR